MAWILQSYQGSYSRIRDPTVPTVVSGILQSYQGSYSRIRDPTVVSGILQSYQSAVENLACAMAVAPCVRARFFHTFRELGWMSGLWCSVPLPQAPNTDVCPARAANVVLGLKCRETKTCHLQHARIASERCSTLPISIQRCVVRAPVNLI